MPGYPKNGEEDVRRLVSPRCAAGALGGSCPLRHQDAFAVTGVSRHRTIVRAAGSSHPVGFGIAAAPGRAVVLNAQGSHSRREQQACIAEKPDAASFRNSRRITAASDRRTCPAGRVEPPVERHDTSGGHRIERTTGVARTSGRAFSSKEHHGALLLQGGSPKTTGTKSQRGRPTRAPMNINPTTARGATKPERAAA